MEQIPSTLSIFISPAVNPALVSPQGWEGRARSEQLNSERAALCGSPGRSTPLIPQHGLRNWARNEKPRRADPRNGGRNYYHHISFPRFGSASRDDSRRQGLRAGQNNLCLIVSVSRMLRWETQVETHTHTHASQSIGDNECDSILLKASVAREKVLHLHVTTVYSDTCQNRRLIATSFSIVK